MGKAFAAREDVAEHRQFSSKDRKKMAAKGQAMSGGGFPIRNAEDLKNAIQAIGRASNPGAARAHIIKRAKALGLTDLIPDSWGGSASQSTDLEEFLQHHGIKGMRWGVRRSKSALAKVSQRRTGRNVEDLSDDELRKVVNRMNLEQQYKSLNSRTNKSLAKVGAAFVGGLALNVAKNTIQNQAQAKISAAIAAKTAAKVAAKKAAGG